MLKDTKGSKQYKIKRNIVVQDYKNGWLKMISFKNNVTALKSNWFEEYYSNSTDFLKGKSDKACKLS